MSEENYFHLLFSWLIVEFMNCFFLQSQNMQVKAFSQINFKNMAVPFKGQIVYHGNQIPSISMLKY